MSSTAPQAAGRTNGPTLRRSLLFDFDAIRPQHPADASAREPDGATLHYVSVNVVVFKHGRITVPPPLVFAGEGFSATLVQGVARA
jgi:hypothetical protein